MCSPVSSQVLPTASPERDASRVHEDRSAYGCLSSSAASANDNPNGKLFVAKAQRLFGKLCSNGHLKRDAALVAIVADLFRVTAIVKMKPPSPRTATGGAK
jgi:hypothetical protein